MKRACLLLLPAMLLVVLAASGCNDESEPIFSRVRVTPECGVAPLKVECFAAVSGGNESGDPMGGTNNLDIKWTYGDGASGNTSVSYHEYLEAGQYMIKVTATDPDGKIATSQVPVTVFADTLEVAIESDIQNGTVATGTSIQFDLTLQSCDIDYPSVIGDAVKMVYHWEMGDAANTVFTGVAPAFTYDTPGDYDVSVRVTYPALAVTRIENLSFTVTGP